MVFQKYIDIYENLWQDISNSYEVMISNLNNGENIIYKKDIENKIKNKLAEIKYDVLSKKDLEELKKILKAESVWKKIKKQGDKYFEGILKSNFDSLNATLKEHNLYMVTAGELESFIPCVGGCHGPEWVNKVLEQYPDFDDEVYKDICDFISSLNL